MDARNSVDPWRFQAVLSFEDILRDVMWYLRLICESCFEEAWEVWSCCLPQELAWLECYVNSTWLHVDLAIFQSWWVNIYLCLVSHKIDHPFCHSWESVLKAYEQAWIWFTTICSNKWIKNLKLHSAHVKLFIKFDILFVSGKKFNKILTLAVCLVLVSTEWSFVYLLLVLLSIQYNDCSSFYLHKRHHHYTKARTLTVLVRPLSQVYRVSNDGA